MSQESQDPMLDDTKRKLDELEARIMAARSSIGAPAKFADGVHKDWTAMVDTHADIRRKLDSAQNSPDALEGIRFDIDILRHSFERWVARVEGNFDNDSKKAGN